LEVNSGEQSGERFIDEEYIFVVGGYQADMEAGIPSIRGILYEKRKGYFWQKEGSRRCR